MSEEEIGQGLYTLTDLVLPVPGNSVQMPGNEVSKVSKSDGGGRIVFLLQLNAVQQFFVPGTLCAGMSFAIVKTTPSLVACM